MLLHAVADFQPITAQAVHHIDSDIFDIITSIGTASVLRPIYDYEFDARERRGGARPNT